MLLGKVHHTAGLAALADSFHNQWLVRGVIQPRLEYVFYLSFIHKHTFSYRLSRPINTFSYRLSVQRYTYFFIYQYCLWLKNEIIKSVYLLNSPLPSFNPRLYGAEGGGLDVEDLGDSIIVVVQVVLKD